jgi:hypothetical protein
MFIVHTHTLSPVLYNDTPWINKSVSLSSSLCFWRFFRHRNSQNLSAALNFFQLRSDAHEMLLRPILTVRSDLLQDEFQVMETQIHQRCAYEMYTFCRENDLAYAWAYPYRYWYNYCWWRKWARSSSLQVPNAKTTMMIESHWRFFFLKNTHTCITTTDRDWILWPISCLITVKIRSAPTSKRWSCDEIPSVASGDLCPLGNGMYDRQLMYRGMDTLQICLSGCAIVLISTKVDSRSVNILFAKVVVVQSLCFSASSNAAQKALS